MNQSSPAKNGRTTDLSLGQLVTLASVLEVTAPKPGNVHRGADFEDATFIDFLASAVAVGPRVAEVAETGVGGTVLAAVKATRAVTSTNTNLGTLLLLVPLAAVPSNVALLDGIEAVLDGLTTLDTGLVYEAIRAAQPGGLGDAEEFDAKDKAPQIDLRAAMRVAESWDLVARQYVNGFEQVFEAWDWIEAARLRTGGWTGAIVHAHLQLMAAYPDSLIARKCGATTAEESASRARAALTAGEPGDAAYLQGLADLDFWLRADHHSRNPGTSADLIAAALFVGLREGTLKQPFG